MISAVAGAGIGGVECDFLVECIDFRSRVTGNKFVINNFNVDCNSDHVLLSFIMRQM